MISGETSFFSPKKVLIIEKQNELELSLSNLVSEHLVEVFKTSGSFEIKELLHQFIPDLIIEDLSASETAGKVLNDIQVDFPKAWHFALSSYEDRLSAINAMKLGSMGYFIKPLVGNELEIKMRKILDCYSKFLDFECLKLKTELSNIFQFGKTLDEIEKEAILSALKEANGSTSKAAERLQISVRKIQYKLKQWNLSRKYFSAGLQKAEVLGL